MKYLGIILTYIAVIGVAALSDWRPAADRIWVRDALRLVNYSLFFFGFLLFGKGLKREAVNEALTRFREPSEPGS